MAFRPTLYKSVALNRCQGYVVLEEAAACPLLQHNYFRVRHIRFGETNIIWSYNLYLERSDLNNIGVFLFCFFNSKNKCLSASDKSALNVMTIKTVCMKKNHTDMVWGQLKTSLNQSGKRKAKGRWFFLKCFGIGRGWSQKIWQNKTNDATITWQSLCLSTKMLSLKLYLVLFLFYANNWYLKVKSLLMQLVSCQIWSNWHDSKLKCLNLRWCWYRLWIPSSKNKKHFI